MLKEKESLRLLYQAIPLVLILLPSFNNISLVTII